MKYAYCTLILVFITLTSIAQIKLSDISLIKSFQSNSDKAKPAIVSFTIPEESENSFLINAAFGIDISSLFLDRDSKLVKLYPNVEYNRNTLIDKEQNQLSTGLAFEWIVLNRTKFIPTLTTSARYSNDYKKEIESFQWEIFIAPKWTGMNTSIKNFLVPDNFVKTGKNGYFGFEYVPYVGLEFENRFKAGKDSLIGDIYRFVLKLETSLYFFPKHDSTDKTEYYYCQIDVNYNYRNEFSNSTEDLLSNNNYIECSLDYTLFKNKNIDAKIGLDYVYGANPSKAFAFQNYYGLSFKLGI